MLLLHRKCLVRPSMKGFIDSVPFTPNKFRRPHVKGSPEASPHWGGHIFNPPYLQIGSWAVESDGFEFEFQT